MPLILAVEPDRVQASHLSSMVRGRLHAELVLADAAEAALAKLGARVPDLILTSALLSTKDEAALADWLRKLDSAAAAHVQTLTIPLLEAPAPPQSPSRTGIFSLAALAERTSSPAAMDGCDPAVFAEQCAEYLAHDAKDRADEDDVAEVAAPITIEKRVVEAPPVVAKPSPLVVSVSNHEPIEAIVEPPPPPQMTESAGEGIEIDLTALLDEKVFQQL